MVLAVALTAVKCMVKEVGLAGSRLNVKVTFSPFLSNATMDGIPEPGQEDEKRKALTLSDTYVHTYK